MIPVREGVNGSFADEVPVLAVHALYTAPKAAPVSPNAGATCPFTPLASAETSSDRLAGYLKNLALAGANKWDFHHTAN